MKSFYSKEARDAYEWACSLNERRKASKLFSISERIEKNTPKLFKIMTIAGPMSVALYPEHYSSVANPWLKGV